MIERTSPDGFLQEGVSVSLIAKSHFRFKEGKASTERTAFFVRELAQTVDPRGNRISNDLVTRKGTTFRFTDEFRSPFVIHSDIGHTAKRGDFSRCIEDLKTPSDRRST